MVHGNRGCCTNYSSLTAQRSNKNYNIIWVRCTVISHLTLNVIIRLAGWCDTPAQIRIRTENGRTTQIRDKASFAARHSKKASDYGSGGRDHQLSRFVRNAPTHGGWFYAQKRHRAMIMWRDARQWPSQTYRCLAGHPAGFQYGSLPLKYPACVCVPCRILTN